MNDVTQKKRVRMTAVMLGVVAILLYFGFMWLAANGSL